MLCNSVTMPANRKILAAEASIFCACVALWDIALHPLVAQAPTKGAEVVGQAVTE